MVEFIHKMVMFSEKGTISSDGINIPLNKA